MEIFRLMGTIAINNQKANEEIDGTTDKAKSSEPKISSAFSKIGAAASKAGTFAEKGFKLASKAALGMAAAGGAVIAAGVKIASTSLTNAQSIEEMAKVYGKTAEQMQIMTYQSTKANVSIDTMNNASKFLQRNMYAASTGTKAQISAFAQLGVSVKDSSGNLRDSNTVMTETLDALKGIENPALRNALAMKIFGRNAMALNPVIELGGKQMAIYADEAKKTGAVMSNEAVDGMTKFKNSISAAKLSLEGIAGTLLSSFIPGLQAGMGAAETMFSKMSQGINNAKGDWGKIAGVVGDTVSQVLIKVATKMPDIMNGALKVIITIVDTLTSPAVLPKLITAATSIIMTLATALISVLDKLIPAAIEIITKVVDELSKPKNLKMLINGAISIIQALADSLINNLPILIPALGNIIDEIVADLVTPENIKKIWTAAGQIGLALMTGIWDFITGQKSTGGTYDPSTGLLGIQKDLLDKTTKQPKPKTTKGFTTGKTTSSSTSSATKDAQQKAALAVLDKGLHFAAGGILTKPTAFGINPKNGSTMIGGEAGDEAIAPIDTLLTYVKQAVNEENTGVLDMLYKLFDLLAKYLPLVGQGKLVLDTGVLVGEMAPAIDTELGGIYKSKVRGQR